MARIKGSFTRFRRSVHSDEIINSRPQDHLLPQPESDSSQVHHHHNQSLVYQLSSLCVGIPHRRLFTSTTISSAPPLVEVTRLTWPTLKRRSVGIAASQMIHETRSARTAGNSSEGCEDSDRNCTFALFTVDLHTAVVEVILLLYWCSRF
jgi:hypothetical protein